jgi:phage gpG-like protein
VNETTIKIRLDGAVAGLRALSREAETARRAFFESLKKPAKEDLREHQKQQRGEQSSWPGLDADTRARGRRARRRRRGLLGRLPRAWKSYISPEHFKLRNMVRWASVHDEGGRVGRGSQIPRRQFVFLGRSFVEDATAVWRDRVLRAWNRP